ncbi:hypothetical protein F0562_016074 [Nyssa sinensis]|uniref:Subtilisin-like protease fibronectin type-III domain-containing protein n=1 Tax=Nyssa sinensis TaxID=561372 RepID=A0A5J4ZIU4_9ASTE|nr:hypothetical protein F0562_016074 [Nyssa sinensis]
MGSKIIGAAFFNLDSGPVDELTPVDTDGHGTHTSSTAAGVPVRGANLYGLGTGTARGGVPSARIAMYKVCWAVGCTDMDLLAGFDAAIADGVDVISVSIGGNSRSFFEDPIAIGAFHAMKRGILTSCSGGNEGPSQFTVQNVAPWILTVAASSIDRQFKAAVKLGNGMITSGIAINTFSPKKRLYPLTNGAHAANRTAETYGNISACDWGTLSRNKVKGKIVYCLGSSGQDYTIKELAPGLSILAAYSQLASITGDPVDRRFAKYNIISGTSMACPHVAAAAAYVKTFHPRWSPAAIKSALMTTATPMKINQMDAELGSGSGQINPTKALHPGLVYDIPMISYIRFLCKEGYNSTTIRLLTGEKKLYNCSSFPPALGADGLNYPSMHIQLQNINSSISAVFYRTVTNVGYGKSVYKAEVNSPKGLSVTVVPNTLSFGRSYQQRSFKVVLKGNFNQDTSWILSASLVWSDSKHIVKSPIVVYRSLA